VCVVGNHFCGAPVPLAPGVPVPWCMAHLRTNWLPVCVWGAVVAGGGPHHRVKKNFPGKKIQPLICSKLVVGANPTTDGFRFRFRAFCLWIRENPPLN